MYQRCQLPPTCYTRRTNTAQTQHDVLRFGRKLTPMAAPSSAPLRVLIVEDDKDIRDVLHLLLADNGYESVAATSPAAALALMDTELFHLVLTDGFAATSLDVIPSVQFLQQRAHPTPVALMTAWPLADDDVEQAGFAFLARKPFGYDRLLAQVAQAIDAPLSADQQRQTEFVRRYFAALTARDWDALIALCADDVTYVLPSDAPFSSIITGAVAFRAYTEETFSSFPGARFADIQVYASPHGLAARYVGSWRTPDGQEPCLSGTIHFQFAGECIQHIGVRVPGARLRAMLDALHTVTSPTVAEPPTR